MPFMVIRGTFHLVGANKNGKSTGFEPDGDSIQFRPKRAALLDQLDRIAHSYKLTAIGSTNLRFEGIDALELHFEGSRQPAPLAEDARNELTGRIGMNPVTYAPQKFIRVKPPAQDGQEGYILSKSLEYNGRPVSFVFTGSPPAADGASVRLDTPLLKRSLNYKLVTAGHAYPLFYDTLYHDLRSALTVAAQAARQAGVGLWEYDWSGGVPVSSLTVLEDYYPIFPKLFRRIVSYFGDGHASISSGKFADWLEAKEENDKVWVLPEWNMTHFDNVVQVAGNSIALTRDPESLVFVSKK